MFSVDVLKKKKRYWDREKKESCKTIFCKPVKGSEEGGGFRCCKEDPTRVQKAQRGNALSLQALSICPYEVLGHT